MKSKLKIYKGFKTLSLEEQAEYLKYLALVIEKDKTNKNSLEKFKNKLEKAVKI